MPGSDLVNMLGNFISWMLSFCRARVLDERYKKEVLADELDKLAELMTDVLNATKSNGRIDEEKLQDLELLRKRVWNRWVSILGESGYATQDSELQAEIEKCVRIAHAAPGAYVEEVYLAQMGIAGGYVPHEIRERFAGSIDRIRDLTTRMRLNV